MQGLKYHLSKYKGENITFKDIDRKFLAGFTEYLKAAKVSTKAVKESDRTLAQGTQWNYFNKLNLLLNKAEREEIIPFNPVDRLEKGERPQRADPRCTFLVLDEVKKLADTPFRMDKLKRAFLFACLCGLRISDVRSLQWSSFQQDSKGNTIAKLTQKKTKSILYLPISPEALKQLPQKGNNVDLVFGKLPDNSYIDKLLKIWAKDAGITKNLTFHCFSHYLLSYSLEISSLYESFY